MSAMPQRAEGHHRKRIDGPQVLGTLDVLGKRIRISAVVRDSGVE